MIPRRSLPLGAHRDTTVMTPLFLSKYKTQERTFYYIALINLAVLKILSPEPDSSLRVVSITGLEIVARSVEIM